MVGVIIQTANRPEMLRQALQSVAAQTGRESISAVYVSENGGNRGSQKVCADFTDLPIVYAFRDPQLSPVEHTAVMMNEALVHEYTAILHDDDWWMPDHLSNALNALHAHPGAVAFCASWFAVSGESSNLKCDPDALFWVAAEFPKLQATWEITPFQVRFAALLATPTEFSSMVIRTDVLRLSKKVFSLGNDFDVDRMLIVDLASHGSLAYRPYPDVCKRFHPGRDANNFSVIFQIDRMSETTRWIMSNAGADVPGLVSHFSRLKDICPDHLRGQLFNQFEMPWCLPALRAAFPSEEFPSVQETGFGNEFHSRKRRRSAGSVLRLVIPPVCYSLAFRLKKLLKSGQRAS